VDLTVDNAEQLRDFYAGVVGWKAMPFDMGDYEDYAMASPESGTAVAGICHALGRNAELPSQWLIYFTVEDLEASVSRCLESGGEVLAQPRQAGQSGSYAVIRDPAGAVCALFQWTGHHHDHDDEDHDDTCHHRHHHHHEEDGERRRDDE